MRGIILAGGTGSRLGLLTKSVNKHLLPVGKLPMIYYPLATLLASNIMDITIVSTASGVGQLAAALGSGRLACDLSYKVQDKPGGIVDAMKCAHRVDSLDSIAVILGDNVFNSHTAICSERPGMAHCYLYKCLDQEALKSFGVASFDGGRITGVVEKPADPPSSFVVTGLYVFDPGVWYKIDRLHPSARGELEVTDLLHMYAVEGNLRHTTVSGFWGDAGTFEGLAECSKGVSVCAS